MLPIRHKLHGRSYCKNLEVVKQAWECLRVDYDVLKAIFGIQNELRAMARHMKQGVHVKGYQDCERSIEQLSWPAVLNLERIGGQQSDVHGNPLAALL
jgi:hypothetical protein